MHIFHPLLLCEYSWVHWDKLSEVHPLLLQWFNGTGQLLPQTNKNNMMMEIWHFCLFHVLNGGRLQPPHCSSQVWCFRLQQFIISSVDLSVDVCCMYVIYSLLSLFPLSHFAFIDTPTYPTKPSVKNIFQFPAFPLRFLQVGGSSLSYCVYVASFTLRYTATEVCSVLFQVTCLG